MNRGSSWRGLGLASVTIASVGACNALGQGVADGLSDRRAQLAESARPVARAAVKEAGRAFTVSVRPRFEVAVKRLSASARTAVGLLLDAVQGHVVRLGDSLTGAGRRAVVEYLAIARDSGAAAVDLWASHVTSLAERRLTVALASALDSLGSGLEPRGPVGGAVVRLGDRVVRQAIVAISEQTQRTTPWWVWAGASLVALSLVAGIGRFLLLWHRQYHARDEALRLLGRAIQEHDDPALAGRVKQLALQRGVEPWLHEYVDQQRLLVPAQKVGS